MIQSIDSLFWADFRRALTKKNHSSQVQRTFLAEWRDCTGGNTAWHLSDSAPPAVMLKMCKDPYECERLYFLLQLSAYNVQYLR